MTPKSYVILHHNPSDCQVIVLSTVKLPSSQARLAMLAAICDDLGMEVSDFSVEQIIESAFKVNIQAKLIWLETDWPTFVEGIATKLSRKVTTE